MLCIICGENSEEVFCEKCFLKRNDLFTVKNIKLNYCCSKDIDKIIEENIKGQNIKKIEIKKKKVGNKIRVSVTCHGFLKPIKKIKKQSKNFDIILSNRKCDNCSKISGGYYESVIQIRNNSAMSEIKKMKLENFFIEKVRDGYNLKFMRKKDATKIAKNLKKHFNVIKTFKLAASKKGVMLYRNYYSVK